MAPVRLEAHARALAGLEWTAFRTVGRQPRRPDLQARRAWRNLDDTEETDKPMALWLEPLTADVHP